MSRFSIGPAQAKRARAALSTAVLAVSFLGVLSVLPASVPAAPADPDGDNDLVCPPGAANASYCTEDEEGPDIGVSPGSVRMTRRENVYLRFFCRGRGSGDCFGSAAIAKSIRTGRHHRFHRITFSSRRFSLPDRRLTSIAFHLSGRGRNLVRRFGSLVFDVRIDARQADSRSLRSASSVTIRS